jgi:hypothetical protein
MHKERRLNDLLRIYQPNSFETDPLEIDGAGIAAEAEELHCNAVIIDAGGGISTFYPTQIEYLAKNPYLQEGRDFFGETAAACKAKDIKVFARNDFGHLGMAILREHPEWALHNWNGEIHQVYDVARTCPLSEMYLEISIDAFREQINNYNIDGIYINGMGGRCCCPRCKSKFTKDTGIAFPKKQDWNDINYRKWFEWGYTITDKIAESQFKGIKSINKNVLYFIDAAGIQSHRWIHNNAQDFTSSAVFQDFISTEAFNDIAARYTPFLGSIVGKWLYSVGRNEKKPAFLFVSSFPGHSWPNSNAPTEEFLSWCAASYLNGISLITPWYGHLNNDDLRNKDAAKNVFSFAEEREAVIKNTELLSPAAVVWSRRTLDHYGRSRPAERYLNRFFAVCSALIQEHVPFQILSDNYLEQDIPSDIETLVLPNTACLSDTALQNIESFIKKGGKLIATYETSLYDELGNPRKDFGLSILGVSKKSIRPFPEPWDSSKYHSYMKMKDTAHFLFDGIEKTNILPFKGNLIEIVRQSTDITVPLAWIPPAPSQPPEKGWLAEYSLYPCALISEGEQIIYFPFEIGEMLFRNKLPEHRRLIGNAVKGITNIPYETNAPNSVEINVLKKDSTLLLAFINHTSSLLRSEMLPVRDIMVRLKGIRCSDCYAAQGSAFRLQTDKDDLLITIEELKNYEVLVFRKP